MTTSRGERFTIDTNILIYAKSRAEGRRHDIAADIVLRAAVLPCLLTLQTISEVYAAVRRKRLLPGAAAAAYATELLDMFSTVTSSPTAIRVALGLAGSGRASYWDALLLATAAEAGCTTILSEDMADGVTLAGVRILNPFTAADELPAPVAALLAPG